MNKNIFKHMSPSRKLVFAFLFAIVIGTILLKIPFSLKNGVSLSWIDSFFTIVSAICVTGLTTVDVSATFTDIGSSIILFFIQIGGLGVMTFSLMFFLIIGSKTSYNTRELLKEERNSNSGGGIVNFIRILIFTVFLIEFIGACILCFEFNRLGMNFDRALYFGIFHSISAFCNAGFTLFSNNLENFKSNFVINFTIGYLITFGSLGFSVINSFILMTRKKITKFNLTSKLALMMTIILTFSGMFLFFALEYTNIKTLGNLTFSEKLLASYFQSVTLRTAGFNTINIIDIRPSTILISCILMFIGASPGSTGGGIKNTTFIIVVFYIIGIIKQRGHISIFNRRIDWEIMNKAIAIFIISLIYIIFTTFLILIIENLPLSKIIYEVVSAFCTVGLSLGVTPSLSVISKIIIMLTMFIGRLGPMTFAIALTNNSKVDIEKYPKEDILVG